MAQMSKDEKTLKSILASAPMNVSAEVYQKTKKKKKTKASAEEPDVWSSIGKPVAKWTNAEMGRYAEGLFSKQFGMPDNCAGWAYLAKSMTLVRKTLEEKMGRECNNECLKAYIEYFFEKHIQEMVFQEKRFTLGMMCFNKCTEAFVRDRCVEVIDKKTDTEKMPELTAETFEKKRANLGLGAATLSFGLVVAVNYLMQFKGATSFKAFSQVKDVVVRAIKSDRRFWENIKVATQHYGPYPNWVLWQNVDILTTHIENSLGEKLERIEVKTCDDNKSLAFLNTK